MSDLKAKAQHARATLEAAIVDALGEQPNGIYNNEIARSLDLESDYEGRQSNYLTYSLLGGLLADGRVRKEKRDGRTYYLKAEPA
jgi:hypothetical protein